MAIVRSKQPANDSELLTAAFEYAGRGWSIIPTIGKKSAHHWKEFQVAPADEATLRRMFACKDVTGLAVILGNASGGLAVRDFDQADPYTNWSTEHPDEAANLPTVKTARGHHVYGRLDEETFTDFGNGELRADSGHYVLLPPSVHPGGAVYAWVNPLPRVGEVMQVLPPSLLVQKAGKTQQLMQPIACVPKFAFEAIEATLPEGPGKRNRKVFDLARRLKGIAGLDTSPAMLKTIVIEWHRRALPVITTKDFAETWTDFQIAWQRVRRSHGTTVRAAYEAALRTEIRIDGDADLGVLAAMCEILSTTGRQPFFLSCRTVEKLFGVPRMTAWRWLNALQFHGVIAAERTGTLEGRQATIWRYTGAGGKS